MSNLTVSSESYNSLILEQKAAIESFRQKLVHTDEELSGFGLVFKNISRINNLYAQIESTSNLQLRVKNFDEISSLIQEIMSNYPMACDAEFIKTGQSIEKQSQFFATVYRGYSLIIGFEDQLEFLKAARANNNLATLKLSDIKNGIDIIAQAVEDYQDILRPNHQVFVKEIVCRVLSWMPLITKENVKNLKDEDEGEFIRFKKYIQRSVQSTLWLLNEIDKSDEKEKSEVESYSFHEKPKDDPDQRILDSDFLLEKEAVSLKKVAENINSIDNQVLHFKSQISDEDIEESLKTMGSWFDRFGEDNMYKTLLILEEQSRDDSSN
jgi:hypothetical protein